MIVFPTTVCMSDMIFQIVDYSRMEEGACHVMKNIGKPCTGKPYARFDEGGLASMTTVGLMRHRQTKGAATDRFVLRKCDACSLPYSFFFMLYNLGFFMGYSMLLVIF